MRMRLRWLMMIIPPRPASVLSQYGPWSIYKRHKERLRAGLLCVVSFAEVHY